MRRRSWPKVVCWVVGAGLFLAYSVAVRMHDDHRDGPTPSLAESDPATGAVLLDLEDDASSDERAAIAETVRRAIAPYEWPAQQAAFGTTLLSSARLHRLEPPASEMPDVLRMLAGVSGVEAIEERVWAIPELEAGMAARMHTDAAPTPLDAAPARGARFVPNDPYYKHQWHLEQIQMSQAWLRGRGRGAVVAVIDTGVLYRDEGRFRRAPDLATTRFVEGHDFVDDDAFPDDEHGHGTHVAGTVAQSTNNGIGVAGVAPEVAVMPVRVLDRNGAGRWGAVAAGIRWAADNGADVINLSLGGGNASSVIRRAIEHAHERGVVVVAAAGNASRARVEYPAAHDHVIAVGAVRFDETLAFYSSYGRHLDLVAPGGDLRVDQNGDGLPDGVLQNTMVGRDPSRHDYVAWQGTSMATPHVAAAAALLRASGIHDPQAVERILEGTATEKSDSLRYGAGLLQVSAALQSAQAGLGSLRGLTALLFAGGLLVAARKRRKLAVALGPTATLAFVFGGGLLAISYLGLGVLAGAESVLAQLNVAPAFLSGAGEGIATPFVMSAVLPVVAVVSLFHVKRLRPVLAAFCCAYAAWLMVEAVFPTIPSGILPTFLMGPWLLAHALGLGALTRLVVTDP